MVDEWNEELRCPKCSKTGMASLSQPNDFDPPSVQAVPVGFRAVDNEFGPAFYCEHCNVEVMP
jgi:hypothetical protein